MHTDGGADGNGVGGVDGASGWGVSIKEKGDEDRIVAEMWGPVVTDESDDFYCFCRRGTNNTGEMAGMVQALLYLLYVDGSNRTACICYDSEWAANMIQGKWKAREKDVKPIVGWAQRLLVKVRETREVRFVHVRGHSSDEGNDRADALVQWGKKSRAYARLRERKEGEQEDIDIIKEGHIASDGAYGRLAIEEYEKEKREKRKERDRESTAKRSQRTGHPTAAKPRFSGDQLGQSTATAGE